MQRTSISISISESQLLQLHQHFNYSASLIGKQSNTNYSVVQSIHAFGALQVQKLTTGNALQQLQTSITTSQDWHFLCLSYDVKNEIEQLQSNNLDLFNLPDVFYFIPKYVVIQNHSTYYLHCQKEDIKSFKELLKTEQHENTRQQDKIELNAQFSKAEYEAKFNQIQHHIQQGDCYELNFCQQYKQQQCALSPIDLFAIMLAKLDAPFMAFLQTNNQFLLSASPERYLLKQGSTITSQPIKGTAKRGNSKQEDELIKRELQSDLKEQTENVMIVDLVRNDLGKCCIPGSVNVVELQQLYSFSTVHQLISTIQGELKPTISFAEIIRNTFPMGSMTGAPKLKVMQLTEQLEEFKRSWYSGAVGYIAPNGDFDLNVIIRSFLYDQNKQLLAYGVGSGITALSNAAQEYEECDLKVKSLLRLLNENEPT